MRTTLIVALLGIGCSDGSNANDVNRPNDLGVIDGLSPPDSSGSDMTASAVDGGNICSELTWLNGKFHCTDGTMLTCSLVNPGGFGAGTCDLICSPGGDTYVGFGNLGMNPSDITLHAPSSFDEMLPPRTCSK